MRIIILFLFGLFYLASAFELEETGEEGVEFGSVTSTGAQTINVNENNNNEEQIAIVKVTGVKGTLKLVPQGADLLNAKLTDKNNEEQTVTVDRLDYEALSGQKNFIIDVLEDNDPQKRQTLNVAIINLDDESPTVQTMPCTMKENTVITPDVSECKFTVGDPDGWLSTMDYSAIYGPKGESGIFQFQYKDVPADDVYTTEVYLVLKEGITLDYEDITLYTFHVNATDKAGHAATPFSASLIVQVGDMPDQPPRWESNFRSVITVPEKQEFTTTVSATDGDVGVMSDITYSLESSSDRVTIDSSTGTITVEAIDRDRANLDLDQISVTVVAEEVEEPHEKLNGTITFIIEDIDDNVATITVDDSLREINISIDEGTTELSNIKITANDIDSGENALYDVTLESTSTTTDGVDFTTAFSIIPGKGYGSTSFILNILNPSLLDYEDQNWQVITMKMITKGSKNEANVDTINITISLNDINDEIPKFEPQEYNVRVREDIEVGSFIAEIKATDRDAEDADLKHELLGTLANRILHIEDLGGNITTKDTFDFEKQQEIIVQIVASDKGDQSTSAQLTISVEDVNDETPRLTVSSSIKIDENQPDGVEIDSTISASDEDSDAYLTFSIDWSKSYATKNSQRLSEDFAETIKFIQVETIRNDSNNHIVTARLTMIETAKNNTPDFETYDNLYLYLEVNDSNTEIGTSSDSALIVISINDVNDNEPQFPEDVETMPMSVTENAANGALIAAIVATDKDVGNRLTYSIKSADENTPMWVAIDDKGSINVFRENENDTIDCDDPIRWNLTYIITVTDSDDQNSNVHTTTAMIIIGIEDQNDNSPSLDSVSVEIPELDNNSHDGNGKSIITLDPKDKDRDLDFNTVTCDLALNTDVEVRNRFRIENNEIFIHLEEGTNLDREEKDSWTFTLRCVDNFNRTGGGVPNTVDPAPTVTITLTDINDNLPTIKNTEITDIESKKKGELIILEGFDEDEGENSLINYIEITKITRYVNVPGDSDDPPLDLFVLTTDENKVNGTLTLNEESLQGLYGNLVLTISLEDMGEPPLSNTVDVTIQVEKYNFEDPAFIYPDTDGKKIFLQLVQSKYSPLKFFDGSATMPNIQATDGQGDKFDFTFTIVEDTSPNKMFYIANLGNSQAQLQLNIDTSTQMDSCDVTIQAINTENPSGNAALSKNITINVNFFDKNTDPTFDNPGDTVAVEEGLKEWTYQVEKANYMEGLPEELPIYYLLVQGDSTLFQLDKDTGLLTLMQELDYEDTTVYYLTIQASNSEIPKQSNLTDNKFQLTINVEDVNDNPPIFDSKTYTTTFSIINAVLNQEVDKVSATDVDTTNGGELYYDITKITTSDSSLDIFTKPFGIGSTTGIITSTFNPISGLQGYFTLEITVRDESLEDDHKDTAEVKIYLVTDAHLVQFAFANEQIAVQNAIDQNQIRDVLDTAFASDQYMSNVQSAQQGAPTEDGSIRTVAPIYFIDEQSNVPVNKSVIYTQVTDVTFYRQLQTNFSSIGLVLLSFSSDTKSTENLEATLQAWLIGVAVVLGSLCVILLIAFILKTRALKQRIDKLSNTKFGSQESGLNRTGVTAPNTNKHALEGSNPVYDNEVDTKDIDRRQSVTSGDSDLIGVEDDEKFNNYGQQFEEERE